MYEACVIARQGKTFLVEDQLNRQHLCYARSQTIDAVCGDYVHCLQQDNTHDVIEKILPRNNQLTRIDNFKRKKTIAANIEQIFVVISPSPEYSTLLIDKYLAYAHLNKVKASLIINKSELANSHQVDIPRLESIYYNLVEHFIVTSAKLGYGITHIRKALLKDRSILVGQSGVGK
ncbi:MAG: GTPase RsgA, partial [Pseudomonadota bacterium]